MREQASNLPHDEALKLLGETLGKSIEATQSDPTIPDILDALDANIAATRKLRELVDGDTTVTEEQMAEIAAEITTIAKSFGSIAELAPGVFERRLAQLGNIDAIGQEVGFRIADAKARLEALKEGNAEIDTYVRSETLTPARDREASPDPPGQRRRDAQPRSRGRRLDLFLRTPCRCGDAAR